MPHSPIIRDFGVAATPSATPSNSWALWNLILSIAGAVLALLMCVRFLLNKKREDEEVEHQSLDFSIDMEEDEEEEKKKRGRILMILAIPFLAILAIIIFIFTQDMRLPMVMVDWWTLVHVILFIGGLLCYIFAYKKVNAEEEPEEDDDEYVSSHLVQIGIN